MNIQFNTEKSVGIGFANLLRMMLIEGNISVKPVAFASSEGGSKFKTSENLIDNLEFSYKLADLDFNYSSVVSFPLKKEKTFTGKLRVSDLVWDDIAVRNPSDEVLLESIDPDKECTISIFFDRNKGTVSSEEIRNKLSELTGRESTIDSYSTLRVRFSDCQSSYEVNDRYSQDEVSFTANFKGLDENSTRKNVVDAIDKIIDCFEQIKEKL